MRIRTVKPEFWSDEKIGSISPLARLLFIACFNIADDEGLLNINPMYLRSFAFPYDDVPLEDSKSILGELLEYSLIVRYTDAKKNIYGWIPNFRKHQRIDKPQKSKLPAPSLQNIEIKKAYASRQGFICELCGEILNFSVDNRKYIPSFDHIKPKSKGGSDYPSNIRVVHFGCNSSKCDRDDSLNLPGIIQEDSKEEGKGKEQGKERKGTGNMETRAPTRGTCTYSKEFEDFRAQYPKHRHGGKQQDWASWKVAKSKGMTSEQANEYLAHWKRCPKWQKNGGEFIVAISKWLRGGFWEDMPPDYEPGNSSQVQQQQPKKTQHDRNMEFLRRKMEEEIEKENRHCDHNDDTGIIVRNLPGQIPDE